MLLLCYMSLCFFFFFFKQKTAYEMRISDWSSDVCSSDLMRATAQVDEVAFAVQADGFVGRNRCNDLGLVMLAYAFEIFHSVVTQPLFARNNQIGRASCRARVCQYV